MATLFSRCTKFSLTSNKPILNQQQRSELGKIVFDSYISVKKQEDVLHYISGFDENGITFKVRDYPKYFVPTIDKLIQDFYDILPPPKRRKRITIKPTPIFTSKKVS